jgi:hypothetical protein
VIEVRRFDKGREPVSPESVRRRRGRVADRAPWPSVDAARLTMHEMQGHATGSHGRVFGDSPPSQSNLGKTD